MFRFTIRDLVLLTLMVAMGVGWWLERRQLMAKLVAAEANRNASVLVLHELKKDFDAIKPGWRRAKWQDSRQTVSSPP